MYTHTFRTPRGHPVTMTLREDTSDYNTLASCLDEDEYHLRELHLSGFALDIGAHIGGVTIALAVDNPELRVVSVEPVPDNLDLLRLNVEANGVGERVTILDAAAGDGSEVDIRYGYSGSENACHHAYIGNTGLLSEPDSPLPHTVRRMTSLPIAVMATAFDFAKIDCEGCEWDFDLSRVPHIRGEWHPVRGFTQADFAKRLTATHLVTFSGPIGGPGGFEAVLR